jgi:predicted RNA-binding protein with PUA-like domain
MAGTRRSTRQTASSAPRYNDDSSAGEEGAERRGNGTRKARQKRARDVDEEEEQEDGKECVTCSPYPEYPADHTSMQLTAAQESRQIKASALNHVQTQEVFWLLKAEPLPRYENGVNVAFSIDDLAACTQPEPWSGVRNPQARNNMQAMRKGDLGFFYHSNAKPSGVVGILRVVEEAKVDETAFDSKDPYYDPKSDREKPKWYCVGVDFVQKFEHVVDLAKMKSHAGAGGDLEGMQLVTNSRLSVSRVRKTEWDFILGLAGETEDTVKEEDE